MLTRIVSLKGVSFQICIYITYHLKIVSQSNSEVIKIKPLQSAYCWRMKVILQFIDP
jgi:hypothetical protein